jgi:endo-alpha-N-acetylgalactosaminidase
VTVPLADLARAASAQVTAIGGVPVTQAEPAAVDLSIDPSTPLTLSAGQSATVTTTEQNDGPGDATGTSVTLTAPSGWTVTPSSPVNAGTITDGASAAQTWTVTAPSGGSGPVQASLQASASYTSAGLPQQVTATEQAASAQAPPPEPVITSSSPSSPDPGTPVTLTGQNFGSSQGSSYLTLAQGGTSWGAPYDGAKVTITSWSDTSITFDLPPDSGSFPLQPGTATITVTVGGQASAPQTITITS